MSILLLIIIHLIAALIGYFICNYFCKRGTKFNIGSIGLNSSALISDEKTEDIVGHFGSTMSTDTTIPGFNEARLAWVSFHDLRTYMRYIEFLSIKNGLFTVTNFGVRIYYGRYPDVANLNTQYQNPLNTIDDNYRGRHTLVFVPTFKDGEENFDFNPHHIEKGIPNKLAEVKRQKTEQNKGKSTSSQGFIVNPNIITNLESANTTNIDVNLNSFGLTPPKHNVNLSAAYIPPQ
jgi:hypothetical protein